MQNNGYAHRGAFRSSWIGTEHQAIFNGSSIQFRKNEARFNGGGAYSRSMSTSLSSQREQSTIIAAPIARPAREEPAPRDKIGEVEVSVSCLFSLIRTIGVGEGVKQLIFQVCEYRRFRLD